MAKTNVLTLSGLSKVMGEPMKVTNNYQGGWWEVEGMITGASQLVKGYWDTNVQDVVFSEPLLGSRHRETMDEQVD